MTDEEITIEVAKLEGFEQEVKLVHGMRSIHYILFRGQLHEMKIVFSELPKYLASRSDIIPVIKFVFNKTTCHSFFDSLGIECAKDTADVDGQYEYQGDGSYYEQWLTFCASPRQLCIALLKATGKWSE